MEKSERKLLRRMGGGIYRRGRSHQAADQSSADAGDDWNMTVLLPFGRQNRQTRVGGGTGNRTCAGGGAYLE